MKNLLMFITWETVFFWILSFISGFLFVKFLKIIKKKDNARIHIRGWYTNFLISLEGDETHAKARLGIVIGFMPGIATFIGLFVGFNPDLFFATYTYQSIVMVGCSTLLLTVLACCMFFMTVLIMSFAGCSTAGNKYAAHANRSDLDKTKIGMRAFLGTSIFVSANVITLAFFMKTGIINGYWLPLAIAILLFGGGLWYEHSYTRREEKTI
ncbi:MAG: hypothetical protein WC875_03115 [Candidatus Absconditabacterales bacterium]|jgi:hypothetical protein